MRNLYIDIGSTNIKYCLEKQKINAVLFPLPLVNTNNKYEVEISKITDIILEIIKKNDAENIYFSVQMHGYILSDANHKPLTNYISWRDSRFLSYKNEAPFKIKPESGTSLKKNTPAASMLTIYEENKQLFEKVRYFDSLGSYLFYYLTNNHYIHLSDACPTGFYMLDGKTNNDVMDYYIFKNILFPKATGDLKFSCKYKNKNIFIPIGDNQASAMGSAIDDNSYLLNTGTTSQMCAISNKLIKDGVENRWYIDNKYLLTINFLPGGMDVRPEKIISVKEKYIEAIKKMPKRDKIIIAGGLSLYKNECLNIFKELNLEVKTIDKVSTIEGLKIIAKGE